MSDLFELPESLSPRLRWMREHGIKTEFVEATGEWIAEGPRHMVYEDTEEDALVSIAVAMGIQDWRKA